MAHLPRIAPALLLTTGVGLAASHWRGYGFLLEEVGGACYVLLFVVVWLGIRPRTNVATTCLVVTLLTCGVEFLQLVNIPWLDRIRGTVPGRLLLGTTFAWSDLPAYLVGGLLAWPIGRWAVTPIREGRRHHNLN